MSSQYGRRCDFTGEGLTFKEHQGVLCLDDVRQPRVIELARLGVVGVDLLDQVFDKQLLRRGPGEQQFSDWRVIGMGSRLVNGYCYHFPGCGTPTRYLPWLW